MIAQCIQLLIDSDSEESVTVAEVLRRDCQMPALKQPADHSGDERTAMHQVTLSETQCRLLLAVIQRAKDIHQFTSDTGARGLGGFAENCEELIRWRATEHSGRQYDPS
jgi:hypothetical protein